MTLWELNLRRISFIGTSVGVSLMLLAPSWVAAAQSHLPSSANRDFYISPTGSDTGACAQSAPCKSLQYASHRARPGDSVLIGPGSYGSQVIEAHGLPGKPVTVKAVGQVIVTRPRPATFTQQTTALLRIVNSTYTVISGLHMMGMKGRPDYILKAQPWGGEVGLFSYGGLYGNGVIMQHLTVEHANNTCIKVEDGEPNVTIRNNILVDCGMPGTWFDHGIYASGPHLVVVNNRIQGSTGWGIHIYGHNSPGVRIKNNIVTGAKYAGILSIAWKGSITGNFVYGNGGGLDIRGSKNLIAHNIIAGNSVGSNSTSNETGITFYSGNNAVINNTFYDNKLEIHSVMPSSAPKQPLLVQDNIFDGGQSGDTLFDSVPNGTIVDHNLYFRITVPSGRGGAHSMTRDPQFVAPGKDFHLKGGSPAIGAGAPIKLKRFQASRDLGALCYVCGAGAP